MSQKAAVSGAENQLWRRSPLKQGSGMGLHGAKEIELRFSRYVEELVSVIGRVARDFDPRECSSFFRHAGYVRT